MIIVISGMNNDQDGDADDDDYTDDVDDGPF